MKKIITLLLALAGMVSTASADTEYIVSGNRAILNGNNNNDYYYQDPNNKLTKLSDGTYTLVVENRSLTSGTSYDFKIKVNENAWNDGTTFPSNPFSFTVPESGTYSLVYYVNISEQKIRVIATPMIRWSLGSGNWTEKYNTSRNFTKTGDYTWTYEVSSSDFTGDFSFRIFEAVYSKMAKPSSKDLAITYGGDAVPSAWFYTTSDSDTGTESWKLIKPTYTFQKAIITAVYKPFDTTNSVDYGQWDVSADCYISKTVAKANVYATLGCSDALDLSGLAAKSITAYPLTANITTGIITKGTPITTVLAAGKGVLLESAADKDVTLSIPVSAEAGVSGDNDMVATTDTHVDQVANDGYTNYILAKESGIVGFYKVNSSLGNDMQANTAYLHISDPAGARTFYAFEDDITGIDTMNQDTKADGQYFNLAGQRVAHPAKGLYIVNGKKLIMK